MPGEVCKIVPCEKALQLLDVKLRHDVILAAATALCRGNKDCTPPSSDGDLTRISQKPVKNAIVLIQSINLLLV